MAVSAELLQSETHRLPRRIYRKPPIVEVVLDISVVSAKSVSVDHLDKLFRTLCELPDNEDIKSARFTLEGKIGYTLRDAERGFSVRAFVDRLGFARSGQYTRWEDFRDEAKKIWDVYIDATSPSATQRASLRYVNRLDLPKHPSVDLASYLNVLPKLAEGFAPMLSGFTFEVKMPQPDMPNTVVVLREAALTNADPSSASIILDIEVVRGFDISHQADKDLWKALEDMHDRANQTFESAITDRVRAMMI